ncbi:hypothetical protein EAH68_11975 [Corynebacterium hylobatis]|uniref:Secreted protein n=1 Tax=Corynebacterium hylobatis TaxID=1859290 RepID=A0A430HVK6_9CORY|nr:hypothetical protein [Corynebacterium hylobatis]RSZ61625.1 hypothetical protein EAH68_11975 [Corynebacterium hylobatis]
MKLFSRKALAAVATTVALTTAGVSAPANAVSSAPTITILAEDSAPADSTPAPSLGGSSGADAAGGEEKKGSSSEDAAKGEDKGSSENPKDIKDWLGVAGTVISLLATVFSFVQKLNA